MNLPLLPSPASGGVCAGGTRGPPAVFSIRLDLPPAILSPNRSGAKRAARAAAVKRYRSSCGWAAKAFMPKLWAPGPVRIDVTYCAGKKAAGYVPHDTQNAITSLKAGIDGLVDAGVMPTDSHKWLAWGSFELVTRKDDRRWKGEGVYITVSRWEKA